MSWFERFRRGRLGPTHASAFKVALAVLIVAVALAYLVISVFDGFAFAYELVPLSPSQAFVLFVAIFVAIGGLALLLLTIACEVARGQHQQANRVGTTPYDSTTQFFAIVSHQMRSPLSAIRWLSEMLRSEAGEKLTANELGYVDDIHDQAKQLIRLTNALLSMTGLELGRVHAHTKDVNIFTLLQSVAQEYRKQRTKSLLTIVVRKPKERLPLVSTDYDLLRQVFVNVIGNAIRYSRPGRGAIEVSFSIADRNGVVISVKDQGIGIPAEAQRHVFEKFYRAPNASKMQTEGSGLGLYICKLIADLLGCKMWFTSEEGKGSTFYVQVPVVKK